MERASFASPHRLERFLFREAPCYRPLGDEVARFEAACRQHLPMIVKGPTGCGKARFVEYMAWRLGLPLVPLACNEDTSASDLVGRFLLDGDGTWWRDGPLTLAARHGGICSRVSAAAPNNAGRRRRRCQKARISWCSALGQSC